MHKINFGSGPAALPQTVLQEASDSVREYQNSGLSILEIPHRGKLFDAILEESKSLVNELCELNDEYEILWLQGGRLQFAMIPMNFLNENETAAYIDSGHWAAEATDYAKQYGNIDIIASSKNDNYNHLPELPSNISNKYAYLYLTTNNTIYGTQWQSFPDTDVPLIADMSSDILSGERNYKNFSLFYAVAQKNIGPAGVTFIGVRKDFLNKIIRKNAPILDYRQQAFHNSVLNTPPVFAIYTSLLMLRWIKQTGMKTITENNRIKAQLLYEEIDRNNLFSGTVTQESHRSQMNVCFATKTKEMESAFLQLCKEYQITGIAGHRSVGGFRASLYNAVSIADVEKLVSLMRDFEKSYND